MTENYVIARSEATWQSTYEKKIMPDPCPVCESKKDLASMEMTPELVEEMAASEVIADFCGDVELERRLAICGVCPRLLDQMTCAECGCFVQFRARHATAHCANGLW